jgi:hypothetical protein
LRSSLSALRSAPLEGANTMSASLDGAKTMTKIEISNDKDIVLWDLIKGME